MKIGDKIGNHQIIINANSDKSAEAIAQEIIKAMPYLDGAITVKKPTEIKPLSELI
ncbi:hypothetical protein [Bacillus pumilus]|uniref:hypothetical protein n=1 Tax=Bacillus pumilus TaxID=1408 RepID=UPI001642F0E5|nr:hypothetical protein [Bacillus pumilus]